ncbi:DNA-binding PucR family transcriptional regulator [Neobacillus niacini]|uniref:helix-turn-helix domain-containing protein n=1 Tax=Neobacillus niacini TaxID=86668 RepID=UPI00285FAC7C|nr:helix-turn-helix domain-containing protein [Neobacillus niacini]MDR7076026.1 DNA-binding PucR family transcriptional regulator [Neobacillus niacini]
MQDTLTHRQLRSLIHVANVINSTLDIDTIFDSILNEAISAVDACGGGSIWVFDKHQNRLIAKSAQGLFYPHIFKSIKLLSGESMTGMTFAQKKCLVFRNELEIKQALSTLTPLNRDLLDRSIRNNIHFTSVISSPILLKGECIGVITLDSFEQSLHFQQEDINLLEAIGHQAAIALEKSSLYREKEKTVRKLSRSIETHRNLANLVVNGEGIQSIMHYIHKKIGQHIFLFDDIGELIGSACLSSFTEEMTDYFMQYAKQIIPSLENSRTVSDITLDNENFQLVVLLLGSKLKSLGVLMILSKQKMSELDISALEHASTILSLELVKEQAIIETQQRLRGEFVTKLFTGQIDEALIVKAKNLNFDSNRNYVAFIINVEERSKVKKVVTDSAIKNLLHMTNKLFLERNLQGMAVMNENQIVALLSYQSKLSSSSIVAEVKKLAKNLQDRIQIKYREIDISIGIGRMKPGLLSAHESFKEAIKCIKFLKNYHFEHPILCYTDLGVQRFILQNSEEELIDFIQEVLGPLIQYEQSRKGELLSTLIVYLDQNQNIKKTADFLHIHTNTLSYRLKRIEEILLTDLNDSQPLFNIHLAISIYQYIKDKDTLQKYNS